MENLRYKTQIVPIICTYDLLGTAYGQYLTRLTEAMASKKGGLGKTLSPKHTKGYSGVSLPNLLRGLSQESSDSDGDFVFLNKPEDPPRTPRSPTLPPTPTSPVPPTSPTDTRQHSSFWQKLLGSGQQQRKGPRSRTPDPKSSTPKVQIPRPSTPGMKKKTYLKKEEDSTNYKTRNMMDLIFLQFSDLNLDEPKDYCLGFSLIQCGLQCTCDLILKGPGGEEDEIVLEELCKELIMKCYKLVPLMSQCTSKNIYLAALSGCSGQKPNNFWSPSVEDKVAARFMKTHTCYGINCLLKLLVLLINLALKYFNHIVSKGVTGPYCDCVESIFVVIFLLLRAIISACLLNIKELPPLNPKGIYCALAYDLKNAFANSHKTSNFLVRGTWSTSAFKQNKHGKGKKGATKEDASEGQTESRGREKTRRPPTVSQLRLGGPSDGPPESSGAVRRKSNKTITFV